MKIVVFGDVENKVKVLSGVFVALCISLLGCQSSDTATDASVSSAEEVSNTTYYIDPRDNQEYPLIRVNETVWMARNLNYEIEDSYCYHNLEANCLTYGRLYDWETAQSICPQGWHLASQSEWEELANYFGGFEVAMSDTVNGDPAKSFGQLVIGGSSGFNAMLGGYRIPDMYLETMGNVFSRYDRLGISGFYWTDDPYLEELGMSFVFSAGGKEAKPVLMKNNTLINDRPAGFSCRCVKNK